MKKFNEYKRLREENSIEDVLKLIIRENRLEEGIDNIDARNAWINLLGPGIANYTLDVVLKREVLYVALSSPILREELSYGKQKIIRMINDDLGKEVIKDLVLR
ncbi:DUF721 domain-containing protein [Myroides indicus]|uniref:Uncharacterized protein DUF721 n=1 Tax=Myroides indicus TaxID=1323422 RepID=A0A4R7EW21_9FLAO|nr:DUF721 domain-containing protein [Myroides indicus]TDS52080.1 uncharacterized protein DUF721 [Myroides indicus]